MIIADIEQQLLHRIMDQIYNQAEVRIHDQYWQAQSQPQTLDQLRSHVEDQVHVQLKTDFKRFKRLTHGKITSQ